MVDPVGPTDEIESTLIDLSDLNLDQLRSLDKSALGDALRQVLSVDDEAHEPVASFGSRI